jgi:aspartate/methionine/tyrosine aminotransferase
MIKQQITSTKVAQFQESVIREMTRIANKHGAVNLGQGRPDFPCPLELKEAASQALFADVNQYAITKISMPYSKPEGAYYIFADIGKYGYASDIAFAKHLLESAGIAVIPGASFFSGVSKQANSYVRFCFSRNDQTLQSARELLWKAKL